MHRKRRIGLYGGTFNPVHHGHLNLALQLQEKGELSEVWWIPAHVSPLRKGESMAAPVHRLEMLKRALAPLSTFKIRDDELQRPPPSYTIDTIRSILKEFPQHSFYLLLGEDALISFKEWKEPEELIKIIPIIIGCRIGVNLLAQLDILQFPPLMKEAVSQGMVTTTQMEISATQIRERLNKKLYCGHLLSENVLDYIYENQLYFKS